MSKLSYKVSYYVLYAIFAAIVVVLCLFYFGGQMESPIVSEVGVSNPAYTDALIYLMYIVFGLTTVATLVAGLAQFIASLKDNGIKALKSLTGIVLIAAMLIIAWSVGSDVPLVMPGYEGTENVHFWLKLSDMFIFSLYTLIALNILAMIFSSIKKKVS